MTQTPTLTDRNALELHRARAGGPDSWFVHDFAIQSLSERLKEVNRRFTQPAIIGWRADAWATALGLEAKAFADNDALGLPENEYDLIIHALCLHWADDPVGQLVQMRRALRPDGLMIAILFADQTLANLRASLTEAEIALTGGVSPRVLPMADIRDLGALLQRAGFALPVADVDSLNVNYSSANRLFADLRGMGETNALAHRHKAFAPKELFKKTTEIYRSNFGTNEGLLPVRFDLAYLTGWAPSDSQQKPLRPGSAQQRLADALGVHEEKP